VCLAFLAARAAVRLMAKKTELFGEPKVMFQALTVWQIPANGRCPKEAISCSRTGYSGTRKIDD
jgi:hypothetical protein